MDELLILGSTGCVGRALARSWPGDVPARWQARPGRQAPAAPALAWDPAEPPPAGLRPAAVIHLATPPGLAPDAAAALTGRIAGWTAAIGARLLFASSQAVYGAAAGPVTEDSPATGTSEYASAKRAAEAALAAHPDACALRIGNVAGCDMLLGNAARGPVTLDEIAPGQGPRRVWIGPKTLAQSLIALARHPGPLPRVLNLGQPGLIDMAALLRAAGRDFDWRPAPAGALAALDLRVDRAAALAPLPPASAAGLVAEARAAGWGG